MITESMLQQITEGGFAALAIFLVWFTLNSNQKREDRWNQELQTIEQRYRDWMELREQRFCKIMDEYAEHLGAYGKMLERIAAAMESLESRIPIHSESRDVT